MEREYELVCRDTETGAERGFTFFAESLALAHDHACTLYGDRETLHWAMAQEDGNDCASLEPVGFRQTGCKKFHKLEI